MKTDTQLHKDVMAELKWEPSVNADHVGVVVTHGVVTLSGHVDSYAEKWSAERAAQRVYGVKALAVEIDVMLGADHKRHDADIAHAAESVLRWLSLLPSDRVKVMVEGGFITLTGELDWEYQRKAAVAAVRYLFGVIGVNSLITLRAKVVAGTVKDDIDAALRRRASAEAKAIRVDVKGSEITLSGPLYSWAERQMANNSAWNTPGVHSVIDRMTVVT